MIVVTLFGPTTVTGEAGRIHGSELGGAKPRQLLGILALHPGTPLSKDQIAERLWEGRPPASHIATVESYVCVLRRRLGLVGGHRGSIATTSHGYVLDADLVDVDVVRVRQLLGSREGDVLQALDLASGELLADEPYATWATEARDSVAELLSERCIHAARQANQRGDHEVAVRLAREAMRRASYSESALRELMTALIGTGGRARALDAYQTMRHRLAEELGLVPEDATRSLFSRMLRRGPEDESRQEPEDEISALLGLLRRALTTHPVTAVDPSSMHEVGRLLLARVG